MFDRPGRGKPGSGGSRDASSTPEPGKRPLVQAKAAPAAPVQARGGRVASPEAVHEVAAQGVEGGLGEYPHRATIEDRLGVELTATAHTGHGAAAACDAIGAEAYAMGNQVAFRSPSPDLHTATHEAVHTMQQAGSVQLLGGVGTAGDRYEQQADAVADAVVAGRSAESLLGGLGSGGAPAVQRQDAPAGEAPAGGAPAAEALGDGERSYVVFRGDSLWRIARTHLGAGRRWPEIYDRNRDVIGGNPNLIRPGQRLVLPPRAQPAAAPAPAAACAPPGYPHVILASGDELGPAELASEEARVTDMLTSWRVELDPSSITVQTSDDCAVIILAWQASWGPLPQQRDLTASLGPLDARLAVTAAKGSPGWASLDASAKGQVEALLGGETNALSAQARSAFAALYSDPGWDGQPAAAQAAILEGLLTSEDARPDLTGEGEAPINAAYTLGGPTVLHDHEFRGVVADADRWDMRVDGRVVPIYAPHAPDPAQGHFHSVREAADAVASLPPANRAVVTSINLNAVQNPDDAFWAVEYDMPGFRSYMTAGAAGDIDVYPTTTPPSAVGMGRDMIHETGHTWSKQQWGEDTSDPRWQPWLDAMASDRISVSDYATRDPDEDVAETIQTYCTTKGTPAHDEYRAMVPARFAILDPHF